MFPNMTQLYFHSWEDKVTFRLLKIQMQSVFVESCKVGRADGSGSIFYTV